MAQRGTDTKTDAIALLTADHLTVEQLFQRYEQLPPGDDRSRRQVVDEVIKELSIHAAIEEMFFYPYIRDEVDGGEKLAEHGLDEHQEVKNLLADLEDRDPNDPEFDRNVRAVIDDVREHVQEEEREFFPKVRQAATDDQLAELGERLERGKSAAPTRPHPNAPNTPPGNMIAGPAAAMLDRARQALSRKDGDR